MLEEKVLWDSKKINEVVTDKAELNGSLFQDFNTRDLNVKNDLTVNGQALILDFLTLLNGLDLNGDLNIGKGVLDKFKVNSSNGDFFSANDGIVTKDLYVGGKIIAKGDNNIDGNLNVEKSLTVKGDVLIEGSVTKLVTEIVEIADNIIELNSNLTDSDIPTEDSGIQVKRGKESYAYMVWKEDLKKWVASNGSLERALSLEGHFHSIGDIIDLSEANVGFLNGASINNEEISDKSIWTSNKVDTSIDTKIEKYIEEKKVLPQLITPENEVSFLDRIKSGDIKIDELNEKAYIKIGAKWCQIYPAVYS
jgi:hypothetical protein